MTHVEMRNRIAEGFPLTIHIPDGRSYTVPHEDFVHLPPRSTVVFVTEYLQGDEAEEQETYTHIIPLLMMSGISKEGVPNAG